jgi:hypothetical protein
MRLSAPDALRLRNSLAKAVNDGGEFRTAAQWHHYEFGDYTQGQVKRQLEVLVRAKRITANRYRPGFPGVYYGPKVEAHQ